MAVFRVKLMGINSNLFPGLDLCLDVTFGKLQQYPGGGYYLGFQEWQLADFWVEPQWFQW